MLTAIVLGGSLPIHAAPGDLDPIFGNGGKVIDGLARAGESGNDVAIQPDGKIVAVGSINHRSDIFASYGVDFALVRYNPDGSLDQSFGSGGKVWTRSNSSAASSIHVLSSVTIQPDGKIVAAGWSGGIVFLDFAFRFAVVRYNTDGSLDTSFGSGGIVTTPIPESAQAYSVAIHPDGKIVVAGGVSHGFGTASDFALVRYNPNGSLDASFGNQGIMITPIGSSYSSAYSVVLQPDNKAVLAGEGGVGFALVRYTSNGSLDTMFGNGGIVSTRIGSSPRARARSVALLPDGRIVASGASVTADNFNNGFAIVRYDPGGSLDASFGDGGIAQSFQGSRSGITSTDLQPDGLIAAIGEVCAGFQCNGVLARFDSGGSLDPSFGIGGLAEPPPGISSASVRSHDDGKILIVGSLSNGNDSDIALVRYNPNGSLDPSFDADGRVTTDFGVFAGNRLYSVVTQPDGKVVAAGEVSNNYLVARYNANGSIDTAFGNGGRVTADAFGYVLDASVAMQPDGKIVVAGLSYYGDEYDIALDVLRYNPDGSPDLAFGDNGRANLPASSFRFYEATWLVIQPDGKILAGAGELIYRLDPDGTLDTTFSSDGVVDLPGFDFAFAGAIQADGKIVTAGGHWTAPLTYDLGVTRFDPNGTLDTTFGSGGLVTTPMGVSIDIICRSVALQTNGKIVAGGYRLVRYNNDGSLDTGFGIGGIVTPPIGPFREVAIQPDEKLLIIGDLNNDFAIARYNSNGSLDTSFGGGDGISTADFNNSDDVAHGMALDGQGRAVVVGSSDGSFALARFRLDPATTPFDYDGDGRADISVFRPGSGDWYLNRSTAGLVGLKWGLSTDKIAPADYDGDAKTDVAVYRPSEGRWYIFNSATSTFSSATWGVATDIPTPGDFDNDGRADVAIFRPSDGNWWLNRTSAGTLTLQFGANGDHPVVGDYDGDGKADVAAFRPSSGVWYIFRSASGPIGYQFGVGTDKVAHADYDGDGKTDIAVYRPYEGKWYIVNSGSPTYPVYQFGAPTDIPTPSDYDGDGRADIAIFRPSDGNWWINRTTAGLIVQQFGVNGDKPTPNAFGN